MSIRNNISALNAQHYYSTSNARISKTLEKLSSGYRINRAGDDSAGLAISEKMRFYITGLGRAEKNAREGIGLIQTGEGALQEIHDMLNRAIYLAEESANGTYSDSLDRENLQKELDQIRTEIDRIASGANFNGIKLFQDLGLEFERGDPTAVLQKLEELVRSMTSSQTKAEQSDTAAAQSRSAETETIAADTSDVQEDYGISLLALWRDLNVDSTSTVNDNGNVSATNDVKVEGTLNAGGNVTAEHDVTVGGVINAGGDVTAKHDVTVNGGVINADGDVTAEHDVAVNGGVISAGGNVTATDNVTVDGGVIKAGGNVTATGNVTVKNGTIIVNDGNGTVTGAKITIDGFAVVAGTLVSPPDTHKSIEIPWDELAKFGISSITSVTVDNVKADAPLNSSMQISDLWLTPDSEHTVTFTGANGKTVTMTAKRVLDDNGDVTELVWYIDPDLYPPEKPDTPPSEDVDPPEKPDTPPSEDVDPPDTTPTIPGGAGGIILQIGAEQGETLEVPRFFLSARALDLDAVSIATQNEAATAIVLLRSAVNRVSDIRGDYGALQNRLDHTINSLNQSKENLTDAESRIRDTDVAEEYSLFLRINILQQASQAMLAQANQVPQGVLQLLQ